MGQNRGRGGSILTQTNSFFLLGVLTSVPILVKIDQEMRSSFKFPPQQIRLCRPMINEYT